jgi:hypothetical protein
MMEKSSLRECIKSIFITNAIRNVLSNRINANYQWIDELIIANELCTKATKCCAVLLNSYV